MYLVPYAPMVMQRYWNIYRVPELADLSYPNQYRIVYAVRSDLEILSTTRWIGSWGGTVCFFGTTLATIGIGSVLNYLGVVLLDGDLESGNLTPLLIFTSILIVGLLAQWSYRQPLIIDYLRPKLKAKRAQLGL